MAENKKSFILYADMIHVVRKMPKDKAGELLLTILSYVNDENPVVEDLVVDLVFEPIKRQMKRDLVSYESKKEQWSDAGKKSAEAKRIAKEKALTKPTNVKTVATKSTVTVNDTVTDINYKGNFFYIGTELFKFPISKYVKIEHEAAIEVLQMQNKEISIESVYEAMDKECVGKHFNDIEHTLNAIKWTYRDLLKAKNTKPYFKQETTKTTASQPKAFPKDK